MDPKTVAAAAAAVKPVAAAARALANIIIIIIVIIEAVFAETQQPARSLVPPVYAAQREPYSARPSRSRLRICRGRLMN
jgi:hypothetical protein